MNVYTPVRYDERVFHLAYGVEPRDATTGARLDAGIDVRLERFPRPVDDWRTWRPGDTLTAHLPRLHRHRTGRFARRYDELGSTTVRLRVVDDVRLGARRVPGLGRRIVPRRAVVVVADEADVLADEANPLTPPHEIWRRAHPLWCFPGADAALPSGATVLRGRVVRTDPVSGDLVAVRWTRVRARNQAGVDVGWAHGDDRGEFALVVAHAETDIVVPADPLPVTLTVGAVLPPTDPDPADPLLASVDPLWDLPVETLTLTPDPASEPTLTGRAFLPEHSTFSPLDPPQPIDLLHGRETSITIRIS